MSVIGHPDPVPRERAAPGGVAACLICLGVLGVLGSVVQLAAPGPRHLVPWAATILLAASAALLALPRVGGPGRRVARALSTVVVVSASTAVAEHLTTGPGGTVGSFTDSWYGGGTAPLVPGLLGQSALLLLLASFRAGPHLDRLRRRLHHLLPGR